MNLIEGLNTELLRAKQLQEAYETIPTGVFGAAVVRASIDHAELSIKTDDLVEMVKAYNALKNLR